MVLPEGEADSWQIEFLGALGSKIGGGTDNMQKKAIAERVLGLPRERNGDEDVP